MEKIKGKIRLGGYWDVEHYGKDGSLKSIEKNIHNRVVDEGLTHMLDSTLHASTQITTWYVLPFEDNYTFVSGETYAVPGFTESTAYDEATRPEYEEAACSSLSVTNSANKATFTFNATKTIYGAALVGGGSGATTKGDTAGGGTLFAGVKFSGEKNVESGDTLNVTYTISAADDGA